MGPRRLLISPLLILALLFAAWPARAATRETRTLTLGNGLEVLLLHDPEVHRSAAALSVGTGDLYDPEDKPGLAHYLEHMLFLGTRKYPEANSFEKYLSEHSGAANAYTGEVVTNYFFQVSHGALEGALDRFSQFFTEPLFDKTFAEREVNAVASEFDKNKLRDSWRVHHAINQIAEPGHPIKKFSIGNKETLAGDNRPALLDFYGRYYAASNMKLAILSDISLPEQQGIVERYFAGIPDHPVDAPSISSEYRKPLKGQYRLMKIKTIQDTRKLTLTFPTIRLHDYLEGKPGDIVAGVVGHEGKGSLLSKLKEEGLALALSAGADYTHRNLSSFDINVELTREGEKEYQRVMEIVFAYLRLLKDQGIQEYTFKEAQAMAQINFDWKDPDEGMGFAAAQAALMQQYPLKDVETLPYLYRKYLPQAYAAILATLTPKNMLAVLQSRSVATDRKAEPYGTEYSINQVGGISYDHLLGPPMVQGIHYPDPNNFIPSQLALIEQEPVLVRDDNLAKVWFQFDTRFNQPRVSLKLRIETPYTFDTLQNHARSRLYAAAVREALNEGVYPIQLAGLSYDIQVRKRGIVLTVGGYSAKISDLILLVARNLSQIAIDEQKFSVLQRAMIRRVENRKLSQAYRRAQYYNRLLWRVNHYDEDSLIAALNSVTLADLKEHAKVLYGRAFITGVAYGNWTAGQVRESLSILLGEIKSEPLPKEDRYQERIEVLDPGEAILFSTTIADNNNALFYRLQVGPVDFSTQATTLLLSSIVESDFFYQLRTKQQLGYIVTSQYNRDENRLFFNLIIQSADYDPFELQDRVESWMRQVDGLLTRLTDEEFERHRTGLIVSLKKRGDSIPEVAEELFRFATRENGNFEYRKQVVEAVKSLKKSEVVAAARTILLNPDTPRLVLLLRSQGNHRPLPDGVLTTVAQFKNRKAARPAR